MELDSPGPLTEGFGGSGVAVGVGGAGLKTARAVFLLTGVGKRQAYRDRNQRVWMKETESQRKALTRPGG